MISETEEDFKKKYESVQKFLTSFLPSIVKMSKEEKKHIERIKKHIERTKEHNKQTYFFGLIKNKKIDTTQMEGFLKESEGRLKHYQKREEEYLKFVLDNDELDEIKV